MKAREYCCCAIPVVNAGILAVLTEQFALGIIVGTLSIATPSSQLPFDEIFSLSSWVFLNHSCRRCHPIVRQVDTSHCLLCSCRYSNSRFHRCFASERSVQIFLPLDVNIVVGKTYHVSALCYFTYIGHCCRIRCSCCMDRYFCFTAWNCSNQLYHQLLHWYYFR